MAFTTIQGSGANDATSFVGTSGVDTITINAGTITDGGTVFAGAQQADDTINVLSPTGGVTGYTLRGGQGADTIALIAATSITNSYVNANSDRDNIQFNNAFTSTVHGGQGNDTINSAGLVFQSLVNGNKNNDAITTTGVQGGSLFGGQGNDTLNVNAGNTYQNASIDANKDNDTINVGVATSFNNVTIQGAEGNDSVNIAGGLTAFTDSTIFGGEGNDTLNGAAAAVGIRLEGGDGNDQATGGAGADILNGGAGTDSITANAGTDTITGGVGNDNIATGAGSDRINQGSADSTAATVGFGNLTAAGLIQNTSTVTFGNGLDVVTDFTSGADTIAYGVANVQDIFNINGAGLDATMTALAQGNYFLVGAYNAITGVFTVSAAGGAATVDTLIIQNTGTNTTVASNIGLNAMVLSGTVLAAGATGVNTDVIA